MRRLVAESGVDDKHREIAQQYELAPPGSNQAVVFALVISVKERESLIHNLETRFPGRVSEEQLGPNRLEADLASVGRYEELSAHQVPQEHQLGTPPEAVKRLVAKREWEYQQRQQLAQTPGGQASSGAIPVAPAAPDQRLAAESTPRPPSESENAGAT